MKCDAVEREISACLDGEEDFALHEPVSAHVAGCAACRAFQSGALSVRELSRLQVAPNVPAGLLGKILGPLDSPKPTRSLRFRPQLRARPLAAAFLLGAFTASVTVGGLLPRGPSPALATEIPRRIARAVAAGCPLHLPAAGIAGLRRHRTGHPRRGGTRTVRCPREPSVRCRPYAQDIGGNGPG